MIPDSRSGSTAAERAPAAPWGRVWLGSVLAALVVLGSWEALWRGAGWVPTASDPAAWVVARSRVQPRGTVLVGASRMQAAVDPAVWAGATGEPPPPMLALFGATPLPVIDHLAADATFRGTVIVDFFPGLALDPAESEAEIAAYIAAWELTRESPGAWIETRLSYAVNPELVLRRPVLSLRSLMRIAWDRAWPRAVFAWPSRGMRRDRFYPMDFVLTDREAPAPRDLESLVPRRWDQGTEAMLARLERSTRSIEERGGRVVFVFFPHCGARRAREERVYPRSEFWDPFAARTSATAIHFADYTSLSGFDCPDGSHLRRGDTATFTRALAQVVAAPEPERLSARDRR